MRLPGALNLQVLIKLRRKNNVCARFYKPKISTLPNMSTTHAEPAHTQHIQLENQEAECRAAVAWAKDYLDKNPQAKLAIVAPQLSEIRNQLADLLDDVFYPASVRPNLADSARNYNFSLGTPLSQQPMIQAALNLLRMFSSYQLQQADVSSMLLSPFWSASQQESDARAILDAKMREKLPMQFIACTVGLISLKRSMKMA